MLRIIFTMLFEYSLVQFGFRWSVQSLELQWGTERFQEFHFKEPIAVAPSWI